MSDEPLWEPTEVEAAMEKGPKSVPAIIHEQVPGVAVTMSNFGEFTVTHLLSGRSIDGPFERAGSACLAAVRWTTLFDMTLTSTEIGGQVNDDPVPEGFGTSTRAGDTRPLTKREWVEMHRHPLSCDEFPWESSEDHPGEIAERILAARRVHTPEEP